jgi:hypothetical protein
MLGTENHSLELTRQGLYHLHHAQSFWFGLWFRFLRQGLTILVQDSLELVILLH